MEILLSTTPNQLSRIILTIIMIMVGVYEYYIFFRWIVIKDEVQKKQAIGTLTYKLTLSILIAAFIEIGEKYFGMIGIYINIMTVILLVRKLKKKII